MCMKKIVTLCVLVALSLHISAQLAWDSEFSKDDYNNALTVISKTENVSFSNPTLGIGGGLKLGKIVISLPIIGGDPYQDECVIALQQIGLADSLSFAWQGGSGGSLSVYQSIDHNNWSMVYTHEGNTISTDTEVKVGLSTTTRYLKFYATGNTAVAFRKIKVTELKRLSASTDEWPFGQGMVDEPIKTKNVTVTWTNIIAEVSSTDPHFSATISQLGQKNLIDQTTTFTIQYSHAEAGLHSGDIVISGEGREVRIAVSGETKKYDQTLTWNQTLGECIATDLITLNAYTSSGLEVIYETSDSTIAKVEDGIVRIRRSGTVTLTATQPGNYKYNAATSIEKTLIIYKADPNVVASVEDLTYGQRLSEAILHENNGFVPGTLTWLNIDVNTILDAGDYDMQVLFTPTDTCIYNLRTLPVSLRVNKAVQTIVWEDQETELTVGHSVESTATLSSGLPITYAYTACLLSIEDGMIVPENEGDVTVVAYHPGNHNYLPTTVIMQHFHIQGTQQPIATGTEQLTPEQQNAARKFLHAGELYLNYGGRTYDANGRLIIDF